MITVTDLAKDFGGQTLFRDVNLQMHAGGRYGIVGANGAGKSTLLRIFSGEESSSKGEVSIPKNHRIGMLEQDHFKYDQVRILDLVMAGHEVLWKAMEEKEALLDAAEEGEFDDVRYSELEDIIMQHDGYGLEARAGTILAGLGVPQEVHDQPLSSLSGGFKLRALLAKTLTSDPDLLFLDEPTNHLDILAIKWLEEFLAEYHGCAVVISHDLRFLDAVCTHILDVDYQRVMLYKGNYSDFNEKKEEHRVRQEAEIKKREAEIEDHKAFIARFAAKATKARQANSRQKRMEKIVIDKLPVSSRRHPGFRFVARRPSGREVLKIKDVCKSYGEKVVLKDVSLTVERGDRLAIIGANGIGKSTLLKIAMGKVSPDSGTAEWGYESDPGYFPQDHMEGLGDPNQAVSACLWDVCPGEGLGAVLARLAAVLFDRDAADKMVANLSGGEGSRLLFARLTAMRPTVLVLDEPTNHLDFEGIEALASALEQYDGTLIFVSHDRWFVDKLATRVLDLRADGAEDFRGDYKQYLARHQLDLLDAEAVVKDEKAKRKRKKKKGGARA